MAQIVETIDLAVPVTVAYNQWTQFESFPEFLSMVDNITQVNDLTNHWTVTIAGNKREFDTVITEQIPDDRIAWTSVDGDVDHAGVITFHKLSETSSRAAVQIDWQPEGFVERAGAAFDIPDHVVKAELANFKTYVEQHGGANGGWRSSVPN
jgi:uncharacterized membrane protein